MNEEKIFIPAELSVYSSCTLSRTIPAIRVDGKAGQGFGKAKLGPMLHLPAGFSVDVCGDDFNPKTVKVHRWS